MERKLYAIQIKKETGEMVEGDTSLPDFMDYLRDLDSRGIHFSLLVDKTGNTVNQYYSSDIEGGK